MCAFIVTALEVQRRSLEQLAEDRIEHVVKEGKAKYKSELVKEVWDSHSKELRSYDNLLII